MGEEDIWGNGRFGLTIEAGYGIIVDGFAFMLVGCRLGSGSCLRGEPVNRFDDYI